MPETQFIVEKGVYHDGLLHITGELAVSLDRKELVAYHTFEIQATCVGPHGAAVVPYEMVGQFRSMQITVRQSHLGISSSLMRVVPWDEVVMQEIRIWVADRRELSA